MSTESRGRRSELLDAALWAASLALYVLSLVFSWGPSPRIGPSFEWSDKAWHFLGYGALCGTLLLAAVWRPGRASGRFAGAELQVALFVLVVAWLTEALQAPFHRDVQLLDAGADLAGVAAGFLAWEGVRRSIKTGGTRSGSARPDPTSGSSAGRRFGRTRRSGGRRTR